MSKEIKIREEYGGFWNQLHINAKECALKHNGLINSILTNAPKEIEHDYKDRCYRPKSLQGIENNNGWIKIESEADLPKENLDCWFYNSYGMFRGYFNKKQGFFYDEKYEVIRYDLTHYKPIEKPLLPIY
jgi:hypothetical protein